MVRQQIEAVFAELRPGAVKSGMLYSQEIVRVVAEAFMGGGLPPLIVDPVMVSTSGARLLEATAIKVVQRELLPLASLATPNLDETEMLTEKKIRSVEEMRSAARKLHERFGCAALIKGGHMRGLKEAVDIFYDGKNELLLTAPFVPGIRTHGTGCTYSAAIAGYMALGHRLTKAVGLAKEYITGAIAASRAADGHAVLGHFWKRDYAA
jgi:hydroxymethylpyrimidine/phosphomethylpyrimidine kinase